LRCLAAGRPTISTDLVHTVEIPTLDPRNWSLLRAGGDALPVGVSIDLLDEDHSLRLAIRRLATDASLRKTLGSGAYALWGDRFRLERMIDGYTRVIGDAPKSPQPRGAATLPEHLRSTGFEHARQVMHDAGLSVDVPALFTAKRD
jgi:hypothetical protein